MHHSDLFLTLGNTANITILGCFKYSFTHQFGDIKLRSRWPNSFDRFFLLHFGHGCVIYWPLFPALSVARLGHKTMNTHDPFPCLFLFLFTFPFSLPFSLFLFPFTIAESKGHVYKFEPSRWRIIFGTDKSCRHKSSFLLWPGFHFRVGRWRSLPNWGCATYFLRSVQKHTNKKPNTVVYEWITMGIMPQHHNCMNYPLPNVITSERVLSSFPNYVLKGSVMFGM